MNDLDQLKQLLFGAEKQALDQIADRVERREVRTADVSEVLSEAIARSYREDEEFVESLTQPVGDCLRRAFRDDPQTYGDALYPVMGPAIRKSIMHALRNFSQQINEAVEHSVSPQGLKWRWQASRAGIPFGEYVLQKTMRYRVEQAYLISRENGLLVGHVHHEASRIKDSDAVSAMFTAIQDFVKESFSPDRTGRLESADMGDFTLWAVHGPHALLVCVIRGMPPKRLRTDLTAVLERIHFRYGEAIREYKGDTATVPEVEVELERCLRFEARAEKAKSGRMLPVWMIVLLLLLLAAAAFFGFRSWTHAQQLASLEDALRAAPGIHVTDIERNGSEFAVRGLRDPVAISINDIAASVDVPVERVAAEMQPFQSLEPEIIAARAGQLLNKPDSVQLSVVGTTLVVSGTAPAAWKAQLLDDFRMLAGVDTIDLAGLADETEPALVTVPKPDTAQLLRDRLEDLNERRFLFDEDVRFAADHAEALERHAIALRQLQVDADEANLSLVVTLTGHTDGLGSPAANTILAERRAATALEVLTRADVAAGVAAQPAAVTAGSESRADPQRRYVQIDLQLQEPPEVL
jgi:OOP family OmpA-OmpF porin